MWVQEVKSRSSCLAESAFKVRPRSLTSTRGGICFLSRWSRRLKSQNVNAEVTESPEHVCWFFSSQVRKPEDLVILDTSQRKSQYPHSGWPVSTSELSQFPLITRKENTAGEIQPQLQCGKRAMPRGCWPPNPGSLTHENYRLFFAYWFNPPSPVLYLMSVVQKFGNIENNKGGIMREESRDCPRKGGTAVWN